MVAGEPIGGTETIGDLCAGERELRAGQAEWRGVVERRWSGRCKLRVGKIEHVRNASQRSGVHNGIYTEEMRN